MLSSGPAACAGYFWRVKGFSRLIFLLILAGSTARMNGELSHQVYVWQRAWSATVCESVAAHATNFSEIAVLAAEVSWKDKLPRVTRVSADYQTLVRSGCPVGLVLRVGPYQGALGDNRSAVDFLAGLAASLVAEARKNQVQPVELQIDFDCAESKLDDYRQWLGVVQHRLAPLPVTITALPSWLNSTNFPPLVAVATNYVLQVHSLEKPTRIDAPFTLCSPAVAKQAVARAGIVGVPFRVALPTYTYIVAFHSDGQFFGLAAEQPRNGWPAGTQTRDMSADPVVMSSLVRYWSTNATSSLRGIIWYRLPVAVDNLNWRWPTLAAIVAGREPHESFHSVARRVEPGLVEISLVNDGELDISSRLIVKVRWSEARLVAGDGLRGFELADESDSAAQFQNHQRAFRLRAGEKIVVGWLRFDRDREVQLEAQPF